MWLYSLIGEVGTARVTKDRAAVGVGAELVAPAVPVFVGDQAGRVVGVVVSAHSEIFVGVIVTGHLISPGVFNFGYQNRTAQRGAQTVAFNTISETNAITVLHAAQTVTNGIRRHHGNLMGQAHRC